MELSGPRWKRKDFAKIASSNPMPQINAQLKSYLSSSNSTAFLVGTNSLLESVPVLTDLLNRTAFGQKLKTIEEDEQIFKFGPEETFYLYHELKCINVLSHDNKSLISEEGLWNYMRNKRKLFPVLYKAYSYLRNKNWVVKCGIQYGAHFVAYRHHPALVHSEYTVIVEFEGARIRVWSDLNHKIRVCNSVAKTILVLGVRGFDEKDLGYLNCLEKMVVNERTITRWIPSQNRDSLKAQDIGIGSDPIPTQQIRIGSNPISFPSLPSSQVTKLSGPRWKGKDFAKFANSIPMSQIMTQLKSSLWSAKSIATFYGTYSILETTPVNTNLLNRTAFSQEKDTGFFLLDSVETFYLFHELKCINVLFHDNETPFSEEELWNYMRNKKELFPVLYKAYSHLRNKNWVVKSGATYAVDFVAYRHHLALVHSEYAVIVEFEGEGGERKGGSIMDLCCTIRDCNGVAKTVLVLEISGFDEKDLGSLNCLEKMVVDERTLERWTPSRFSEITELDENL